MKCKLLHSKTREIKVIQNIKFSQNRVAKYAPIKIAKYTWNLENLGSFCEYRSTDYVIQ